VDGAPLLDFIRHRGATGVGVTLSSAQAASCRSHGLDVHVRDAREVTREVFGPFDARRAEVLEGSEACHREDYRTGRQEEALTDRGGARRDDAGPQSMG